MNFYLSANAMKDVAPLNLVPETGDNDEFMRHWYIHRVVIERRKCFIAMEAHTRYAMLFCGVTKPVLKNFPLLFADYFWRHIVSLCSVDDADFGRIKAMASKMCADITYHKGLNRSVQAHIKDVAHQLEWDIHSYGFPADPGKEFFMSMQSNEMFRRRHGEKDFIIPLKEFQRLWCGMLGVAPVKK
ncbi:hypothetical protein LJC71_11310 [Desulfosarcina sp. OttesenSCG-928-A07]|nr:hypothetical protein [Desulfosarcina sp. OttesenSCG-928-G17]MDL2330305.1 hypothetical protein [Desulfosarcina sp. OttesenSCG-928-A07]